MEYGISAAVGIAAAISEDWDGNYILQLKSLISASGRDLITSKSGISSFLIELDPDILGHVTRANRASWPRIAKKKENRSKY